jgi:hypothetical protein
MGSSIKATTGFQSQGIDRSTMVEEFQKSLDTPEKHFDFIQSSLRHANEIYKKGGHVIMVYADREFKLVYDNRRQIDLEDTLNDPLNKMLKSLP